jgi:hypothetical protein
MSTRTRLLALALAGTFAGADPALAQLSQPPRRLTPPPRPKSEPRVTVSVSGGAQAAPAGVSDRITFERNFETETIDVDYPKTPGALFDVAVGVRVWKQLGFGVAVGRASGEGTADVTASVPHPFFFTQPRTVTGKQSGMTRDETGVHVQVQYAIRASPRVRIVLSAGPSRLKVEQDVVTDVNVTEVYPYDTATFKEAVTKRSTDTAMGFNAGFDLTWKFTRNVGLGGLVRYTRADANLDVRDGRSLDIKAGGVQAAAGIRFAF